MDNESGKNISDADKVLVEKYMSSKGDESGKNISDADKARVQRILAGEENKPDADGYRAGGSVNISNFKGSF